MPVPSGETELVVAGQDVERADRWRTIRQYLTELVSAVLTANRPSVNSFGASQSG